MEHANPAPSSDPPTVAVRRFLSLAFQKARDDHLVQHAAALAFTTIVSLVPLLAAFSFFGARVFSDDQERIVELLAQVLPYSEATLMTHVRTFLGQAKAIGGVGSLVFLVTALGVFTAIEETINRIWNVSKSRPLRSRLLSLILILVCGPLVIGASYYGLYVLEQQPALRALADSLTVRLLPSLVTVLGLTLLYWMVPSTDVRFRSAFLGGLVAALLLEGLRRGFALYIESFQQISIIYGSFGLALFFMISIHVTWLIVLLGTEVAYCVQNFELLVHPRRPAAAAEGSWLGLAALVVVTDRFRRSRPITPQELLAERLRLSTADLRQVLEPLLAAGFLVETRGDDEGYVLACDPYQLELETVFERYEDLHAEVLETLPKDLGKRLETLRAGLRDARRRKTKKPTLAELMTTSAAGSTAKKGQKRAAAPRRTAPAPASGPAEPTEG